MSSFKKPEYSVIQSLAMTRSYKWTLADVFSRKNIFSTVGPSYNEFGMGNGILFDMKTV